VERLKRAARRFRQRQRLAATWAIGMLRRLRPGASAKSAAPWFQDAGARPLNLFTAINPLKTGVIEREGEGMTRPRAADDFTVIRTRMLELQRERMQAWDGDDAGPIARSYRNRISGSPAKIAEQALKRALARATSR
jgi:hypothetical protein